MGLIFGRTAGARLADVAIAAGLVLQAGGAQVFQIGEKRFASLTFGSGSNGCNGYHHGGVRL
jgi:hypothetical protein